MRSRDAAPAGKHHIVVEPHRCVHTLIQIQVHVELGIWKNVVSLAALASALTAAFLAFAVTKRRARSR